MADQQDERGGTSEGGNSGSGSGSDQGGNSGSADGRTSGATTAGAMMQRIRRGAPLAALTTTTSIVGRILVIAVALIGLYYLLSALWVVVLPVILALLLSSVLWPVNALLRRILPPALAAAITIVGFLAVVVGVGWLTVVLSVDGVRELSTKAVENIRNIGEFAESLPFNIPNVDVDELLTSALNWIQANVAVILTRVTAGVGTLGSVTVTILLALVLTFFSLKDGDRLAGWLLRWTTGTVFVHAGEVFSRSWKTLSAYVLSQAAVALVDAVFIGLGLWFLDVPLALPLAILVFFGGFLPVIGAVATGLLATLVALLAEGWVDALVVLGIVLLVQQLESNVLQPILVGKSLKIHPAVVLTGVTAGGTLFGIVGAFLATPIVAVVMVALQYAREQMLEPAAVPHLDTGEELIRSETEAGGS
ncbi:AI-2E family transporter [Arthrobacter echini]|uniref:AI-2E family transporter n=1 Tax=Arthrobacter echini TaxID=1529066 RepID=A0A5D0XUU2_9MICC|nr:AI-2E family transporter [Arthrobacter echini]TYD00458.1 AI-2E family transporter [Arthrobacter echini]